MRSNSTTRWNGNTTHALPLSFFPTFAENEINGRRTTCVSARLQTTQLGRRPVALVRTTERIGETGTEVDSHKKRVGERAEMRKRTQSEFQFTPGRAQSNGGREQTEGGGKSVQEGRETCYFFLDLSRHTYTERERETHNTEELNYGAVWRRD